MQSITLNPCNRASGSVQLPGSKSISNRTLLLAALSQGTTEVLDLLQSDDTDRMLDALRSLGVALHDAAVPHKKIIQGNHGQFAIRQADLFLGNAGTAFRPLTAALAFSGGNYVLSGVPRMHERPIGDLVDALRQTGANIEYMKNPGYPPLRISPASIDCRQGIRIRGDVSSQFLTALLMALPLTGQSADVHIISELISKPYIEITLNLMERFGVQVEREGWQHFHLPANQHYRSPTTITVEGDASSASYFLAAGAIAGEVSVLGVGRNSIQGDVKFADALAQMGATISYQEHAITAARPASGKLQAIDLDCNHIPDAAMTLAMLALFAEGTTHLRNIGSWRVKETDRISAMATELRKLGASVQEGEDNLRITPPTQWQANAGIDTYDDHRMAMCFSLACLAGVSVNIHDPGCVAKTFPDYFSQFKRIVTPS